MQCYTSNLNSIAFLKALMNHGSMGNLHPRPSLVVLDASPERPSPDNRVPDVESTPSRRTCSTMTSLQSEVCTPCEATSRTPAAATEAATQTRESPAALGRRLAAEALGKKEYSVSARAIRKAIVKRLTAHVRLPRASGSMRFKFKLDVAPLAGIREICEAAGLEQSFPLKRTGSGRRAKTVRTWFTNGPNATSKFGSLQLGSPLAWGGAKLTKAPKGSINRVSRVATLLAPPLKVTQTHGEDEDSCTVAGYLVTYNEAGEMRLPPNSQELWGDATDATARVLKKYAKKMIGQMAVEGLPLSQTFKRQLGPQYALEPELEPEPEVEMEEREEEEVWLMEQVPVVAEEVEEVDWLEELGPLAEVVEELEELEELEE